MKKIFYCFIMIVLISTSCDNSKKEFDINNVKFKDLQSHETKLLIKGKWQILQQCVGVIGCNDVKDSYIEFDYSNIIRYEPNGNEDIYKIKKWIVKERGCEIVMENEDIILLVAIENGILIYTNGIEESHGITSSAIRIEP